LEVGVPVEEAVRTLATAGPASRWRMEVTERADGVTVVNDAYNANPDSMRAALATLASMGAGGGSRTVALLGEMLELGDGAAEQHEAVGRLAIELGIDRVVAVGPGAAGIHDGATAQEGRSTRVADTEGAIDWAHQHLGPGDIVLVKASRASGLERVASALLEPGGHNASGTRSGDEGNDAR
ncbi:MAG: glutamate ligase domain-containing protein, partial [Nocardioidaceae bacterium]